MRLGAVLLSAATLCSCYPTTQVETAETRGTVRVEPGTAKSIMTHAQDGDSLVDADGTRYRLLGINAPDEGECLADTAAVRLGELVEGNEVQVFHDGERQDQYGRQLVFVYLRRNDEMLLINELLVSDGLALAIHTDPPSRHQSRLFEAQEVAIAQDVGLWNPTSCGDGTLASIDVVEVNANPAGPDEEDLEGEYVTIASGQEEVIDLTGWSIRDESTQNRYRFPDGTDLAPGETVTVTSGDGPFGFASGSPIWNNSGDTVYVLDERGRIVAYATTTG